MGPKTNNINLISKLIWILFIYFFPNRAFTQFGDNIREKVLSINEAVQDPDKQVGSYNPEDHPNLPIGLVKEIGGTKYIIAIDSAYFLPDGAYFSAYMAIDLPGADKKLAFAAKDIKFNPEGVIGGEQAKLQLVSDHMISMGPNTRMFIPGDGSNYVQWNCNGFELVNLHGVFLFSDGILQVPENSTDSLVSASFEIMATDVNNIMTSVDFSPFVIRGMEDFSFTVTNAYVDMNDFANPSGVQLPSCYQQIYGAEPNLWRGFYIEYFAVELPDELSKNDENLTLYANQMFIDDAGVTGNFGGENLFSSNQGEMAGKWGFSVDLLEIQLTMNSLTGAAMEGEIKTPLFDEEPMDYMAMITQNPNAEQLDYLFGVDASGTYDVPSLNSSVELNPGSVLQVLRMNGEFRPSMCLSGEWSLDNPNANVQGVAFQNFTVIHEAPYVTNGVFSLVSSSGNQASAGNYPISISQIGFGFYNNQPAFGATVALNLGEQGSGNSFSAETSFRVKSLIEQNSAGKTVWSYNGFQLTDILIDVETNAFDLLGVISFHDDDPVYGKGFYGSMNMSIDAVMQGTLGLACAFGNVNDMRYWMVDATIPTSLVLGQIMITSLTGGIANHMVDLRTTNQMLATILGAPLDSTSPVAAPTYVPDPSVGLAFKAGVAFQNLVSAKTLNGGVLFTIAFNANGGLQNIGLAGKAFMMKEPHEEQTSGSSMQGSVAINYDNQQQIFDAQLDMQAQFAGGLTALIWSHIYLSPNLWYVHLGRPSQPCQVNLYNLASASAYFMFGQNLEPMPPPPPEVASVFSSISSQRNTAAIASGNGVSLGMNLSAGFANSVGWDNFTVYGSGYAGAGFDMTLYKYAQGTHCQGSSEPFGLNNWYLNGQLYAYAGLAVGIAGTLAGANFDVTVLSTNIAMILQGKMPRPSYVFGGVHIDVTVLSVINLDMTYQFELGEDCQIVN